MLSSSSVKNECDLKTVYLMGGLGNALFQLNFLYNLRAQGFSVKANCTLLKEGYFTNKILGWSDHQTFRILLYLQLIDNNDVVFDGCWNLLAGALAKICNCDVLQTRYFGHDSPLGDAITVNHFLGYFHMNNPINKLFSDKVRSGLSRHLITSELSYVRQSLKNIGDTFVVHVRGGDYVRDSTFAISNDYYRKALSGQRKCYIITNDKRFSTDLFRDIDVEFEFLETRTVLEDFIVLALCRNKVLANSTFSWWAAELGNLDGVIIQREPFFDHITGWRPDSKVSRRLILN